MKSFHAGKALSLALTAFLFSSTQLVPTSAGADEASESTRIECHAAKDQPRIWETYRNPVVMYEGDKVTAGFALNGKETLGRTSVSEIDGIYTYGFSRKEEHVGEQRGRQEPWSDFDETMAWVFGEGNDNTQIDKTVFFIQYNAIDPSRSSLQIKSWRREPILFNVHGTDHYEGMTGVPLECTRT